MFAGNKIIIFKYIDIGRLKTTKRSNINLEIEYAANSKQVLLRKLNLYKFLRKMSS